MSETPLYVLRFISGKYQGGEFPLSSGSEIVIGRSSDLDMVLVEDMVSRRHAKIAMNDGNVILQDLGSTNGSFVNGEKVKRIRLRDGDRVLIGTSIIKLIKRNESGYDESTGDIQIDVTDLNVDSLDDEFDEVRLDGETSISSSTAKADRAYRDGNLTTRSMYGSIKEIPLPDLIQLLTTSKKNGILEVESDAFVGRIYLREGQIYFAAINDKTDVDPYKAIYRIMTWQDGTFELLPEDDRKFSTEISGSPESILMEAMRQMDEIARLNDKETVPEISSKLKLANPPGIPLNELEGEQLETLQSVLMHLNTLDVLNDSKKSDFETLAVLAKLLKNGVIEIDK